MTISSEIANFVIPLLLATVSYFLYRVDQSIQSMGKDIGEIKVTIASHAARVDDLHERVIKTEQRLAEYDSRTKDFFEKYGYLLNQR